MDVTDKNILAIGLGLLLVIVSNVIGHFAEPFSIFATPILLTIIIAGINAQLYKSNFLLTVLYNFGLLLFNDLFIRAYAGTHDDEGKAWILVLFAVAFIPSVLSMAVYAFTTVQATDENRKSKIKTNILTVVLSAIFTGLFYTYILVEI